MSKDFKLPKIGVWSVSECFFPDYTNLECNFETMFGIQNNIAMKLFIKNDKLYITDWNETLLPENIQNSYKKWLISKALKEKLK